MVLWKSREQMRAEQEYIKSYCKIIEYAQYAGYHVLKIGRYYTLKEHDSVRIDPDKNCFWQNSTGSRGSVIDFVMCFQNMTFREAIDYLGKHCDHMPDNLLPVERENKNKTKKPIFMLPEKDNSMKQVFAYLTKQRKLPVNIVKYWVHRQLLYQDIKHNCVFVGWNDMKQAVFACKRGTLTHVRYVSDVPGSDYDWCLYIDNKSKELIVCESAIDAMSLMAYMVQESISLDFYDYLVLAATTKYQAIYSHLKQKKRLKKIHLALDNDVAGFKAILKIQEDLSDMEMSWDIWMPKLKDWNDDWKEGCKHASCWKS